MAKIKGTIVIVNIMVKRIFFIFNILIFSSLAYGNNELYPLATQKQEVQFNFLLKELRCLVCQNQNLADSNSELAKDLRAKVYELVRENKSDKEIIDYFRTRYGDFILFNPPVYSLTLFLWFSPFLFILVGIIIFFKICGGSRCN